jgi:hypothetical protein
MIFVLKLLTHGCVGFNGNRLKSHNMTNQSLVEKSFVDAVQIAICMTSCNFTGCLLYFSKKSHWCFCFGSRGLYLLIRQFTYVDHSIWLCSYMRRLFASGTFDYVLLSAFVSSDFLQALIFVKYGEVGNRDRTLPPLIFF